MQERNKGGGIIDDTLAERNRWRHKCVQGALHLSVRQTVWRRRPFGELLVVNCCGMTMIMIVMIMIIQLREQLYQQDRKWGGHDSNDTLPSLCFPF
jgi:hypothetical protein